MIWCTDLDVIIAHKLITPGFWVMMKEKIVLGVGDIRWIRLS